MKPIFIELTTEDTNELIYVNAINIVFMKAKDEEYTYIDFGDSEIDVIQTPQQVIARIKSAE